MTKDKCHIYRQMSMFYSLVYIGCMNVEPTNNTRLCRHIIQNCWSLFQRSKKYIQFKMDLSKLSNWNRIASINDSHYHRSSLKKTEEVWEIATYNQGRNNDNVWIKKLCFVILCLLGAQRHWDVAESNILVEGQVRHSVCRTPVQVEHDLWQGAQTYFGLK